MNNSKLFSDEAANIYERAIGTLLKKNMLLYFAFADYEEVSVRFHSKLNESLNAPPALSQYAVTVSESHEVRESPQHLQQTTGSRGHRPHPGLHPVHEVRQESRGHQIRPLHLQEGKGGPTYTSPCVRVCSADGVLLQQSKIHSLRCIMLYGGIRVVFDSVFLFTG